MKIRMTDGLPIIAVTLTQNNNTMTFPNVLLDTGSGGSVFSADKLEAAGIFPQPGAIIRSITGIGGSETVIEIQVDQVSVGHLTANNFTIESGAVDYGFDFEAILGFDFLQQVGAVIDLANMEIRSVQ